MARIIVTHFNPDLDAFLAIWLVRKFWPIWDEAEIKVVPAGQRYEGEEKEPSTKPLLEDEYGVSLIDDCDVVHVDTGGGMFDHHGTGDFVCAASLVWGEILKLKPTEITKEEAEVVEKLVDYTLKWDHGLFYETKDDREIFQIYNVFDNLTKASNGSEGLLDLGFKLLNLEFSMLKSRVLAEREFREKKRVLKTRFGKTIAIESDYSGMDVIAYTGGFDLLIKVMLKSGQRIFEARPSSKINLTVVYNKIKEIEPGADWFLHASKKLLLCGSSKAGKRRLSNLSLERMIELVK